MSVYYDKKKQLYIVRKYVRGAYSYIGQYETEPEAMAAEEEWKREVAEEKAEDHLIYSIQWWDAMKRDQAKNLHKNYPNYVNGKPRTANKEVS